jgi:ADP-heptose:LPS heptosyltransferase
MFDQGFGRWLADRHIRFDVTRYKAFNYLDLLPEAPVSGDGDLLTGWPDAQAPDVDRGHLVLLPSGSDDGKLWPLSMYHAVLEAWLGGMGDRVTVIAGPREQIVIDWFHASGLGDRRGVALMTGLPLAQQVACLRSAAAVVHNDCGPGHIAQLADRPRVVIFPDWGDPKEWFRPGRKARCLQAAAGRPIASVTVEAVLDALRQVMA